MMEEQEGKIMEGVITRIQEYGLSVRIEEFQLHIRTLTDDFYELDKKTLTCWKKGYLKYSRVVSTSELLIPYIWHKYIRYFILTRCVLITGFFINLYRIITWYQILTHNLNLTLNPPFLITIKIMSKIKKRVLVSS